MTEQIPTGLRHVLEVARLMRRSAMDRNAAAKYVAKTHRINLESVMSACTRGIGLNAGELDDFLAPDAASKFCEHLVRRFPAYQAHIEEFFRELVGQSLAPADDLEGRMRALFPSERKELLRGLVVQEAEQSLARWLGRDDLPVDVRNEMQVLCDWVRSASH